MNPNSKPLLASFPLFLFALLSHAQTAPDAGSLLRESERQVPQRQPPQPAQQAVPRAPEVPKADDLKVRVRSFEISGNTLVTKADLLAALAPWVGREVGFAELQLAVNAVAEEYRKRGWFARPQLPRQDVTTGVIRINVLEARLGAVRIDDDGKKLRVDRGFVDGSMTARQKPGQPLNLNHLERSTSLLNDTPGLNASVILAPGQREGETDAVVKVQDTALLTGTAQVDNQGSRSTGPNKISLGATLDNPTGWGDQGSAYASLSEGSRYLKLLYSRPVGRDGLRLGANVSTMQYELVGDFAASQSKGSARTLGVTASYPVVRQSTGNVTLNASLDRKRYSNEKAGVQDSEKKIDVAVLVLSGDLFDKVGAGGMTLWSVNLNVGQVDLSGNPANEQADRNGPRTAGAFTRVGYSAARLQRIDDRSTVWASLNGQSTNGNLDSSEKMSLGGPSGVRAYPVLEASGDQGWQATVEYRRTLSTALQAVAFYDHGRVRLSHATGYPGAPVINDATLKGAGVGLRWTVPGRFTVNGVLAHRIGSNPLSSNGKDQDGSKVRNRVWVSGIYFF